MNILLVNTFHYHRGGDSVYSFKLADLMREEGDHNIVPFAMEHPQNFPSEYAKYFVPEIDFVRELQNKKFTSDFKVIKRSLYSNISKKKLSDLLSEYPIDIAHIQNIRGHITPSIFHTLKAHNIPIIWTQHDYFLMCPNSTFYSHGRVCEDCKNGHFYNVVLKKCRKNSFKASFAVMLEEYSYRLLGLLKLVDYFVTPSKFMYKKMLENNFPEDKLVYIPHFIEQPNNASANNPGKYLLYIGRLSYEKGLTTLVKAMKYFPDFKLLIAGDGPEKVLLEQMTRKSQIDNVKFLGFIDQFSLADMIDNAMFLIVPSEWYEVFGMVILEAFSHGKTVIGSNIGGIPELIEDGLTGILFKPKDLMDLKEKIGWMIGHPGEAEEMGRRARTIVRNDYSPENHYNKLIKLYQKALNLYS